MPDSVEHPIFVESMRRIRALLGDTGLDSLQQQVLERLIHSSGDPELAKTLVFSPCACELGVQALQDGASLLTDTTMAAAAIAPMAQRTLGCSVHCILDWAPSTAPVGSTRSAAGMELAWQTLSLNSPPPLVLVGSAPTALDCLLDLVQKGLVPPSLTIGMPVGFVGVAESKHRLADSGLAQIRLDGSRGGAGLVGAALNALLRASVS